jgi:hypothetical protein
MDRLTLADAAELALRAGRTRALRLGAAATLVLILAALLWTALRGDTGEPKLAPPGRTTVLVLDVSSSVQPIVFRQIGETLARAIREGGRYGVVAFSDTAYELMSPGTPAAEMEGVRRYFEPVHEGFAGRTVAIGGTRFPASPWLDVLTRGTKISTGLALARSILRRDRIDDGAVLLVSDLEDEYLDLPELGRVLTSYAVEKLPLKVEALSPTEDDRRIFERLVHGPAKFSTAPVPPEDSGRAATVPKTPFPAWLAVLGVGLALALALNEHLCARLPLRTREETP